MFATFMPWLNAPIIGSINGTAGDGWITFVLFAIPLAIALIRKKTKPYDVYLIGIPPFLSSIFGAWKIIDFHSSINKLPPTNPFAEAFNMGTSIGFGLYMVVIAGITLSVYTFMQRKISNHESI